jgi:uncharacterized protein YbjT (DUF2867 family)
MTFRIVITGATGYRGRALQRAVRSPPGAGTIRIAEVLEIRAA